MLTKGLLWLVTVRLKAEGIDEKRSAAIGSARPGNGTRLIALQYPTTFLTRRTILHGHPTVILNQGFTRI